MESTSEESSLSSSSSSSSSESNGSSSSLENIDSSSLSSSSSSSIASMASDLQRTVLSSTDTAIRSARSLQHNSSAHLRSLQELVSTAKSQFKIYEDTFFNTIKDELKITREHPAATVGVGLASALFLLRGPRRFLFRHTLGRFRSEESQFVRAEKNVKDLSLSVDVMRNESKKLLERAALAERDMKYGHTELKKAGNQIQHLSKSVYKVEAQASDLMDGLRETSGREALKLRAEVASMLSNLKKHKVDLDKRIMKISDLGIPV